MPRSGNPGAETADENRPFMNAEKPGNCLRVRSRRFPFLFGILEVKTMEHERFRGSHYHEQRVVSLHGESGGLKLRRERVGTGTTHLAPWSIG